MNFLPKNAVQWLVPVLILVLGTGGSWSLSEAFRSDAERAWQAQADQTARWLSGTVLGWLEESYGPLSGLGVLAENSDSLTEVEFLNAFDGLESRATAFFLDTAAYLRRDAGEQLQLVFSTDVSGPLASGTPSSGLDRFTPTVTAAFAQPGRILLGPPFEPEAGHTVSTVALAIEEPNGEAALVLGLVNYDALIEGLFEQLVPAGLTLQITGKFLGGDAVPVYMDSGDSGLHSVTTRTISADADLSITWLAGPQFAGGVPDKLARFALLAGTIISVIIALFIGMLLRRNRIISQRIHEATRELALSRDAADAANQAKSEFLANMSHELRTPMNAILGYSEMLIEEAEDLEQEDFTPDLKKINQAGTHLLALINDVLDLAKVESGKMEAFAEDIDLDKLIDEVSATAHPLMEKNSNTLSIERGGPLGSARQDLTKLRQTLFNLLSNAAKFTHNGTITLHAIRTEEDGADWLTLAVSDTGIGIPADKIEHVFEEFTQADSSTTRDYGGTGLGLAISRRFCQLLGGDLTAYSEPGEGSTFTIRIPAVLPGSETPHPPTDTQPATTAAELDALRAAGPGATILVIDDDPEAREIIEHYLKKDGYRVAAAGSGEQGLQLAHELRPAAITLDVMMPDMDGWSVLRTLKADPTLRGIPVVMLSMIEDRTRGYSLGAVDYLTKPVNREQLHKALSSYHCAEDICPVLLVEDDADTRDVMARTLEQAGWAVSEAGNGREALDIMADLRPELILLDLMMPVMDGFDFLTALRAEPGWRDIPVIVITAKDLNAEDRDRLSGRVADVVEKNACTREQLLGRVSDAVAACNLNK